MSRVGGVGRLLVRAPNWLGDAVLALPALAALRHALPDADLTVAAPASVAAVFREDTPVAPAHVLELPADARAAMAELRAGRFEACLLLPNSFRSAWQARRAGIPRRWGYATAGRGWLLTMRVPRPSRRGPVHQADYYRELVRGLHIDVPPGIAPAIRASAASVHRAEALLRQHRVPAGDRVVALMPGAAYGQAKQWPASRMAALAVRLVGELDVRCLLLGASQDRPAARAIESLFREHPGADAARVHDLTGQTSLGALVGLLSRAALCVANDSGGMHLAAALGCPLVAIFGPTDERVTGPIGPAEVIAGTAVCRPCMLRDCPIDHRCMKRVTVDQVFVAAAARIVAQGDD